MHRHEVIFRFGGVCWQKKSNDIVLIAVRLSVCGLDCFTAMRIAAIVVRRFAPEKRCSGNRYI